MSFLVFVKIGGSLITDKTKQFSLQEENLELVCREIKEASKTGRKLVIGHGAGSFAHIPAQKYQTYKGIINKQSLRGIAEVADVAAQLNRIIVRKLLDYQVNAVSVSPLSIMLARQHRLQSICPKTIEELLKLGLLPVVYGDQIIDTQTGCTIFSTEKVLGYIALALKNKNYAIEKIIHCGKTEGVYDENGKTIPLITNKNFSNLKKTIGSPEGIDITGGMMHKVKESLSLAKQGIPAVIINGEKPGNISKAITGKKVPGTRIIWLD